MLLIIWPYFPVIFQWTIKYLSGFWATAESKSVSASKLTAILTTYRVVEILEKLPYLSNFNLIMLDVFILECLNQCADNLFKFSSCSAVFLLPAKEAGGYSHSAKWKYFEIWSDDLNNSRLICKSIIWLLKLCFLFAILW